MQRSITMDQLREVMKPLNLGGLKRQIMIKPKDRKRKLLADGRVLHYTKGFRGKRKKT